MWTPSKYKRMRTEGEGGGGVSQQCERSHINFLIEYLVHKLLTIVTRIFASFIKMPVLLKKLQVNYVCLEQSN